jgi:hypothetical protein
MSQIDLPILVKQDSGAATRLFFDTYGVKPLEFSANEVEAAVGFFKTRGFESEAALTTGITILKQARIDGVPVFEILDTLKELNGVQLSAVVAQILNKYRSNSSTLGFRVLNVVKINQTRNILP